MALTDEAAGAIDISRQALKRRLQRLKIIAQ